MNVLMLAIAFVAFLIISSIVNYFLRKVRYERSFGIDLSVFVIGVAYTIFSLVFSLWAFEIFNFSQIDFLIVYSIILLTQTICLVNILYNSNQNGRVFFSLFAILALIPLATINIFYLHFIIPLSLFVILLSFLTFSDSHQKSISFLIAYASFSIMGYLISFVWVNGLILMTLISTILFLLFLHNFLENLRNHQKPFLPPTHKNEGIIIRFLKHFIFIIIITNFIFIGTVSIHEIGHLVASAASPDCDGERIVYELNEFPHTETECSNLGSKYIWILSGLALPTILSIVFFFVGGSSIREIALQIFGFNLLISYRDLSSLGLSNFISGLAVLIGAIFLIASIFFLARSRIQQ